MKLASPSHHCQLWMPTHRSSVSILVVLVHHFCHSDIFTSNSLPGTDLLGETICICDQRDAFNSQKKLHLHILRSLANCYHFASCRCSCRSHFQHWESDSWEKSVLKYSGLRNSAPCKEWLMLMRVHNIEAAITRTGTGLCECGQAART